jgi:hypothetical protein
VQTQNRNQNGNKQHEGIIVFAMDVSKYFRKCGTQILIKTASSLYQIIKQLGQNDRIELLLT